MKDQKRSRRGPEMLGVRSPPLAAAGWKKEVNLRERNRRESMSFILLFFVVTLLQIVKER